MPEMYCTVRFIHPFARLLAADRLANKLGLERFLSAQPDDRLSLRAAYHAVDGWTRRMRDVELGLKAGSSTCVGSFGVLEYAMLSANTLREAVQLGARYSRLLSDGLVPQLEVSGNRALITLSTDSELPRALADYTLITWYRTHLATQFADSHDEFECLLMHPTPDTLTAYKRAFGGAALKFDARCYGFRIPAALVDTPLASREPMLHVLQREHLEQRHAALCGRPNAALRVREFLVTEMRQRRPNAEAVAQRMRVSRRTLVRQLEREHTSFSEQLDKLRHELAVHLVAAPELPLREIAGRLGFSHVQAFHRAFKRWTGQTPIQFRFAAAKQRYLSGDDAHELAAEGGNVLLAR